MPGRILLAATAGSKAGQLEQGEPWRVRAQIDGSDTGLFRFRFSRKNIMEPDFKTPVSAKHRECV